MTYSMLPKNRQFKFAIGTIALTTLLVLILGEFTLNILDLPKIYASPVKSPQFMALSRTHPWADIGHLNIMGDTAIFRYASNERGYFRYQNEVDHSFNSLGFRGLEFSEARIPGRLRIAFFGDSLTVGEGVYIEDTYPQQVRIELQKNYQIFVETMNFAVSAFNSEQEAKLVRHVLPQFDPDILVLGYTMNDPADRIPRRPEDAPNWNPVEVFKATNPPPDLRTLRLIYSVYMKWRVRNLTLEFLKDLHDPDGSRWARTASAIKDVGNQCKQRGIPCVAVLFPILTELQEYPLVQEHRQVRATLEADGLIVLDMLEELLPHADKDLWVHPTDQHPNEFVHRLVSEKLAALIASLD
jgi:lysophospholipase L1-like esterase